MQFLCGFVFVFWLGYLVQGPKVCPNDGPKALKTAQTAIILHILGLQVVQSPKRNCVGRSRHVLQDLSRQPAILMSTLPMRVAQARVAFALQQEPQDCQNIEALGPEYVTFSAFWDLML